MLFDNFINYAMDQAGLTKYKLAKRLGVSQSTIANWMNGTSEPREKRRAEVLDLFGVDEYDLEEGFPEISYKEETPPVPEGGGLDQLTVEQRLIIELYDSLDPVDRPALVATARALAAARKSQDKR